MLSAMKAGLFAFLCSLCSGVPPAGSQPTRVVADVSDTATLRLHISGMTCGSCPTTARLALQKLSGVYRAKVTLEDSLGVVWYDPARVTPPQIVAKLDKLTGFRATILPDPSKSPSRPAGD